MIKCPKCGALFQSGSASHSDSDADAATELQRSILAQLRTASSIASILDFALETLARVLHADRCLIWQIVGDSLVATNEYSTNKHYCFLGNLLSSQESTAIVIEFLSLFPDQSGTGVISIPDTSQNKDLHKVSPTLTSLLELGDVGARLMVQLRSRGIFCGFMEIQQCARARNWSPEEATTVQLVAEVLAVVVQQSFDQIKIETMAREMKLMYEIGSLFREEKNIDPLLKSFLTLVDTEFGWTVATLLASHVHIQQLRQR